MVAHSVSTRPCSSRKDVAGAGETYLRPMRPRFDRQTLLATSRDVTAVLAEWDGDLTPASRLVSVDPDELRRAAAIAADLHFAPLFANWRAVADDPRERAVERVWATVFLIGRRLRLDAGLPSPLAPLELDVAVRYVHDSPPTQLLHERVALLLPHALGPPASMLVRLRSPRGYLVRQALYRLSEHALATAFVGL